MKRFSVNKNLKNIGLLMGLLFTSQISSMMVSTFEKLNQAAEMTEGSFLPGKAPCTLETIDPTLLQAIINTLSEHFNDKIKIKSIVQISEPDRRNLVLRIMLQNPTDEIPTSVILKQSLQEKEAKDDKDAFSRFARDWAGLEFVSNLESKQSLCPRFYGGNKDHRFVLLEDLGEKHVSLVDSLTGTDKAAAQASLKRFMQCLGTFHAASHAHTQDYLRILTRLDPQAESWEVREGLDKMPTEIKDTLNKLGLHTTPEMQKEIHTVIKSVCEPGDFTTYIHGDICPDNTFDNPEKDELCLIDFEWARVGHALLDATYLRMCMPTCWCAGKIPNELIESLEQEYRNKLMGKIPASRDDDTYFNAYVNACAVWMLGNVTRYIEGKLPREARALARLQAFIDVAEKYDKLPHLRSIAKQVLEKLKVLWSKSKPLDLFPAFRADQQ